MIDLCGSARVAGVDKLSGGHVPPLMADGGRTCDFMCRDAARTMELASSRALCAGGGKLFWTSTAAHLASWLITRQVFGSSCLPLLFGTLDHDKTSTYLGTGYSMFDEHLPIHIFSSSD